MKYNSKKISSTNAQIQTEKYEHEMILKEEINELKRSAKEKDDIQTALI